MTDKQKQTKMTWWLFTLLFFIVGIVATGEFEKGLALASFVLIVRCAWWWLNRSVQF